ncbi:MAG: shikimate kinase [Methanomassiliicoccales archaeon]|nr:MAG: shikimate kinase [Methanomassiliicoccales archaeon]
MEGKAYCHGAATIINGIPLGLGAAFGIALRTEADVLLTEKPGDFEVIIEGDEKENPKLAENCVYLVLKEFGLETKYGAKITTRSDIPISRGLKSSSAAANAIVLATHKALDKKYSDMKIINLGIEASIMARVTITGAFDDACATYFGGVVVTDNLIREILNQYQIEEDFDVIIHVPDKKIRKSDVDIQKLKGIRETLKMAHHLALKGNFQKAISINGMAYGKAMGLNTEIITRALDAGALCAGISGTGPATVILAEHEKKEVICAVIGSKEQVICTAINRKKADLLRISP